MLGYRRSLEMNRHNVLFLSICLVSSVSLRSFSQIHTPRTTERSQILSTLCAQFRLRNARISTVEIKDIRTLEPGPEALTNRNKYLILARGVRSDQSYQGPLEDELFGIFVLDDSLFSILRTIDIFPTRRWLDYAVRIVMVSEDTLTIHGEGDSYGDNRFDKRYPLHLK